MIALIVAGLLFAGGVFVTLLDADRPDPGMRFLGIRLQVDGRERDRLQASLRRAPDAIPLAVIPLGLGFLAILVSPRRLAWHDHIAGTEVIYDEASAPWSLAPREWVHPASGEDPAERAADRAGADSAATR